MRTYDQAVEHLKEAIQEHESIIAFKKVEQKMQSYPELEHLAHKMKAYQQDAVLFKKIDKKQAQNLADEKASKLEAELTGLPIVQDYRAKMQDASDLIQYVTKTLEDKINKELANGK